MDASASPKVDLDINVCGFFVQLENAKFRPNMKQNNTIIKYTKLPDFDYDPKGKKTVVLAWLLFLSVCLVAYNACVV